MGPDSQGRHFPRKLCLITPILIISLVLIFLPWSISGRKNATTKDGTIGDKPKESESLVDKNSAQKHIGTLNDNGSTSDAGDYVTGEFLRKALINHTLSNYGETDLDQLIFSALPQGSKLVLQSVKVVETDENGIPTKQSKGKSPVHWDVKVTNATNEPDPDSETEEDEEDEEEDEEEVEADKPNTNAGVGVVAGESVAIPVVKSAQGDLASSGSHSQANYKTYGASDREKKKHVKHHHGNDYGKNNKITHTDTDGKTITNYSGKEDGLLDYKKNKGTLTDNDSERYKSTKKKNKGRRVSGFKRVYHKEEFQRTEHFYDDEDARKIAESYGLKDKKEDGKHGLKDDDRKYHGKKIEYLDGKKVEDEKSTSHGFNKGQQTAYKDSEKHRLKSNYAKTNSQTHGSPPSYNQNQDNYKQQDDEHSPPSQYHHPSHNYHGSYSHPPKTTILHPSATPNNYNSYYMNFKPGYLQTHFSPSSNPLDNADTIAVMSKVPLAASFVVTQPQHGRILGDSSPASSTDEPTIYRGDELWKSRKGKKEPDEIKMYYSPRHRHVKEMPIHDHFPTTGHTQNRHPFTPIHSSSVTFTSKIGGNEGALNQSDQDVRNQFVKSNPLLNPKYGGYSTLIKYNPTAYINLGDEEGQGGFSQNNETHSEDEDDVDDGTVSNSNHEDNDTPETSLPAEDASEPHGQQGYRQPNQYRRPGPPPSRWVSLSLGDPELVKEIQTNPFNRLPPNGNSRRPPPPPSRNLMRPGGGGGGGYPPPRFSPPSHPRPRPPGTGYPHRNQIIDHQPQNQYDASKYPPNVVVNNKRSKDKASHKHRGHNISTSAAEEGEDNRYNANLVAEDDHSPKNAGILPHAKPSQQGFHPVSNRIPKNNNINNRPHRIPHSFSIPPFMNTLMDSVANFFGNVG